MPAVRKVRHVSGAARLSASHFMLAGAEDVNGLENAAASTGANRGQTAVSTRP